MGRKSSTEQALALAIKELGNAGKGTSSIALRQKVETLQFLLQREDENKVKKAEARVAELEEKLAAFKDINPEQVRADLAEFKQLRLSNERLQRDCTDYRAEVDKVKSERDDLQALLKFLAGRCTSAETRLRIALIVWTQFGVKGKVLIDLLMGNGQCEQWRKWATLSKDALIDLYSSNYSNKQDSKDCRAFLTAHLKAKFDINVEDVLRQRRDERLAKQAADDEKARLAAQARDEAAEKRRMEALQEAERNAVESQQSPGYIGASQSVEPYDSGSNYGSSFFEGIHIDR